MFVVAATAPELYVTSNMQVGILHECIHVLGSQQYVQRIQLSFARLIMLLELLLYKNTLFY